MKICKLCGKEFEPKVHNAEICYREHYVPCRICGKPVNLNGRPNRTKRLMYLERHIAYCSKDCACKGIGLDKQEKAEQLIDLNKLKYYIEQTAIPISDIAKIFNTSVDFINARCKNNNFIRSETLKEQSLNFRNEQISKVLKKKYENEDAKKAMIQKQQNTYEQKTGYKSNFQNPESRLKGKKTKLEKYGNENYTNPKKMIETRKRKNQGKFWTDEQIQKGMKTRIKLYGSNNNRAKIIQTNLKNHNIKWWINPEKIKLTWNNKSKEEKQNIVTKQQKTCLKKYNKVNPMQTIEIQNKIKQKFIKKYGVDNPFKDPKIKEQIAKTNLARYGTVYPITLFSYLNNKTISKINKRINEKLKHIGCDTELEKIVGNNSYDILVKPNTLLEINPTYTHNSTVGPFIGGRHISPKDKDYHINKTNKAIENKFNCIHFFDWEDEDKLINFLKPKQKIYARNCILKEITKNEIDSFLNKYHFQNTCNNQQIKLGLFYNNELIQVMSFGKPRYNKNYEWELLRLCTHCDYIIIGGSEKLFKYFINSYNPRSIISYCDNSKFTGNVYKRLGFKFKNLSAPRVHWYNMKTKRHITDSLLNQRGFSQLHNDNNYTLYNKGDNNKELMLNNGYVQVYDCGQSTYIYVK